MSSVPRPYRYEALRSALRESPASVFIPEPLLDPEEAAALMKIHPKTLKKLARRGIIRGIRIGKLWRFRASVIAEWIERQEQFRK